MTEQKRTGPDWEDIRVFLALARYGSLSATARALGINHATVARRIQSLEQSIGERLAERRPDGYVLTAAGTRVLTAASDMETAAGILERGGQDDRPKGLVRINAPPSLSQAFLVKHLVRLAMENPRLDIDIATDARLVSLERRETDIAIRLVRPLDGEVLAKQLVSFNCGYYGRSAWHKRVAQKEEPVFVGFDEHNAHLPDAVWLTRHFPKARVAFRATNQITQAAAASEGAGIALLPHFLAKAHPLLKLCPLEPTPPAQGIWMVTRVQDRKDRTIRLVLDHLLAVFELERDLFEHPA